MIIIGRELRYGKSGKAPQGFSAERKSLLTNGRQKPDVHLLARGGNVEGLERAKVGRQHEELGREGNY